MATLNKLLQNQKLKFRTSKFWRCELVGSDSFATYLTKNDL